jgi:rRNA pseudouridine-1189 N-methylase Emg1 (Nep1/Mra1 family)
VQKLIYSKTYDGRVCNVNYFVGKKDRYYELIGLVEELLDELALPPSFLSLSRWCL